jgi:16S rRNA (guanine527-N7)-methyltransferase
MAIVNPDAQFTLLDSNSKKMAIVEDIAKSLGLTNVRVVCSRAEKLQDRYDFLLGRAVSALPNYLGFSSHLLNPKSKALAVEGISGNLIGSGLLYLKGEQEDEIFFKKIW